MRDKSNTIDFIFGAQKGTADLLHAQGPADGVYLVDTSSLAFLKTKPFDVVDKFIFIPNIEDVDRMDITAGREDARRSPSRGRRRRRRRQGKQDEVTSTYTADGKKVEDDSFKKFYQSVIGLQVEGEMTQKVPDAPEVTVRFIAEQGGREDGDAWTTPRTTATSTRFSSTGSNVFALTKGQLTAMLGEAGPAPQGTES